MKDLTALLKELAAPMSREEKIEIAIGRAADRAGITFNRAFNLWYGRAKWTDPQESAAVVGAVDEKRRKDARNELHELRTRIAVLESRLNQMDTDFCRAAIDALRPYFRSAG